MEKTLLIMVCAVALATGTVAAQSGPSEQDKGVQPGAYTLYTDYRYSFHEVSLSYGMIPVNDITSVMSGLFPSVAGYDISERRGTGAVSLGYSYRLTPRITVGGILGYSGNMSVVLNNPGSYIYKNFYSILPQVKLEWYRSGIVTLYSRLAAGVSIINIKDQKGSMVNDELTAASFMFQVSPIGIELGYSVAGFLEAGFGATGVVMLGIRVRL